MAEQDNTPKGDTKASDATTAEGTGTAAADPITHIYNVQGDLVQGSQHKAGRDVHITPSPYVSPPDKTPIYGSKTHKNHEDDSVKEHPIQKDLRDIVRPRKINSRVRERYMTPKEYRAYTAVDMDGNALWDGIERRYGTFDWTAWDWQQECPADDVIVTTGNRRFSRDRRKKKVQKLIAERRGNPYGMRAEDKESVIIHKFLLSVLVTIIAVVGLVSIADYHSHGDLMIMRLGELNQNEG